MISIITINPNPPAIINNEIIKFKAISFSKLINELVPNKSKPALLKALTLWKTAYPILSSSEKWCPK